MSGAESDGATMINCDNWYGIGQSCLAKVE
jgi:hypothetical protein